MRAAARLLASVKPARTVEVGSPTGLTGLLAHPAPRSALLHTYNSTLEKLSKLPESSAYRTSTEALTKHRLAIVESIKPAGWEEWQDRLREKMKANPDAFTPYGIAFETEANGQKFVAVTEIPPTEEEAEDMEWDGEYEEPPLEGPRSDAEKANHLAEALGAGRPNQEALERARSEPIEMEPSLTMEQLSDLEARIGGGLIEEVIEVAAGENHLVDTMTEAKVWEELAEKPSEGQWKYYDRGDLQYTKTQKP